MELDKIEIALEKYFEGETSIAEDNQLKAYFSGSDIAPKLEQYKPLFCYLTAAKKESFTQKMPLEGKNTNKKSSRMTWLSVAASIVVLLGAGTFTYFNYENSQTEDLGSFDDPEVALRETQKALSLLSKNVNAGVEGMQYLQEYENARTTVFQ